MILVVGLLGIVANIVVAFIAEASNLRFDSSGDTSLPAEGTLARDLWNIQGGIALAALGGWVAACYDLMRRKQSRRGLIWTGWVLCLLAVCGVSLLTWR